MSRVRVWREGDPIDDLAAAVAAGEIVAIPTESSYGLAVDPRRADAVARVMALKGRDAGKPLPVVVADRAALALLPVDLECAALARFASLWPAPLSLLLPLTAPLPATAGEDAVAVRVPADASLRRLLAVLGRPLTATSANLAGEPPILEPQGAAALLAAGAGGGWVVDGGILPGGAPSTLVACLAGEVRIVRAGAFPVDCLEVERVG